MPRRILVPLDLSPYSHAATEHACELARTHRAQVDGITILDTPDITGESLPFSASFSPVMLKKAAERTESAKSKMEEALQYFARTCEGWGVPHTETTTQGAPSKVISNMSGFYDLVVMGLRTHYHFETDPSPGNSLHELLDHSTTPVLAVPTHRDTPFRRILVAFDGSPKAIRALKALPEICTDSEVEVTLLTSDKDEDRAQFNLTQAGSFLHAHGLNNVKKIATQSPIIETIFGNHISQADLIVVGIHSRPSVVEFFLGSLPTRLIDEGSTALLLGQ